MRDRSRFASLLIVEIFVWRWNQEMYARGSWEKAKGARGLAP